MVVDFGFFGGLIKYRKLVVGLFGRVGFVLFWICLDLSALFLICWMGLAWLLDLPD